jgi:hypothetical protein
MLKILLGVAVYTCNPSTWEAEAGRSWVKDNLGYIAEPCLKKNVNQDLIMQQSVSKFKKESDFCTLQS